MALRLKIFEWSDGFHRFTVAASSRPKALAAWGIQQDIFASGLAREAPDSEDAEAARAAPGQVMERGLVVDVGQAEPRPEKKNIPAGPTAAQRRRVEILEGQLQDLKRSHAEAMGDLERDMKALEGRQDEEQQRFGDAQARLVRDLEAAREKL
ncbi:MULTISPECIES: hypothetical protein [unclassified Brevundimonas]|uniref:hypothetical protein n=1 Tax=unclassified Brevundimonas TaxID=2622653 RepID=UPI003F924BB4